MGILVIILSRVKSTLVMNFLRVLKHYELDDLMLNITVSCKLLDVNRCVRLLYSDKL